MNDIINIAIVDDNASLLKQIKENISDATHINVLFTACNGQDFLDKLENQNKMPDVVLMDIEMPVMNGIETTLMIAQNTAIKVLILTVFDNDEKVFDAIKSGAAGYLLKDSKPYKIISAIEDVMLGGGPMSPHIAAKALNLLREKTTTTKSPQPEDYDLSNREIELLQHLVQGASYQQIADKLFISSGTVRKHVQNIYNKLHIHNKVEAVNTVTKHNWFR
jgi:DNA-binding NarL/FixJ family response regulator